MRASLIYNPRIIGYTRDQGPIYIPLQFAKQKYGKLPSAYGYDHSSVSTDIESYTNYSLNLELGMLVRALLQEDSLDGNMTQRISNIQKNAKKRSKGNLKREIFEFYKTWHRDYKQEYGFDELRLINLNDHEDVWGCICQIFSDPNIVVSFDKFFLLIENSKLIKKPILYSVYKLGSNLERLQKYLNILQKRIKQIDREFEREKSISSVLAERRQLLYELLVKGFQAQSFMRIGILLKKQAGELDQVDCQIYADEIATLLAECADHHFVLNAWNINFEVSKQVHKALAAQREFVLQEKDPIQYHLACRNETFLSLGKLTGDCTIEKRVAKPDKETESHTDQINANAIENIYWTVFPWFLDQNYQIMRVYYEGKFVLKVHLVIMFYTKNVFECFMAIDAIEATQDFSETFPENERESILNDVFDRIKLYASRAGIKNILAETYSNTKSVRRYLLGFDSLFLRIKNVKKIDELEDVMELATELAESVGLDAPDSIFCEIQLKNTFLQVQNQNLFKGLKQFSRVQGANSWGVPLGETIGL